MSGYTPGPWTIFNGNDIYPDDGDREARRHIAYLTPDGMENYHCDITYEEHCANARLIAAAPCLLEALEMLLDDHRRIDPHHEHLCPLCVAASAAIQKAKS